jgi:hypothetical protein
MLESPRPFFFFGSEEELTGKQRNREESTGNQRIERRIDWKEDS